MPAPDDPLERLLAGQWPDPETGARLAAECRSVVIEETLAGHEVELVAALGVGQRLAVISDRNTFRALGERVERALGARFAVQSVVVEEPHADADTVARVLGLVDERIDAIVAVGSGTINDLCKMVAVERDCPQLVFATAPSMNGYTSISSSILTGGVKVSVRARTPVGVFFDLGVLAAAPPRLLRAGLGDSVCRSTAQADWLLSHLLLGRAYREAPFALLAADEAALFADSRALMAGDLSAMRHLVRTLVLSGFGMTLCNGSYPASQGEHLVSHYLDMMRPADVPQPFHGEQIGVCTVAMARLQDQVLARAAPPLLRPGRLAPDDLVRHFGAGTGEACWREYAPKRLDAAATDELNARLATGWDEMRSRLQRVTLGAPRIAAVLAEAGAPVEPADLGCPPALFQAAIAHAREIRNRYTFLDLVADSEASQHGP